MKKNKVRVNLILEFDHGKPTVREACGIDMEKIKDFIINKLFVFIESKSKEGVSPSEIVEYIAKNMPAEYLASMLDREVKTLLFIPKKIKENSQENITFDVIDKRILN